MSSPIRGLGKRLRLSLFRRENAWPRLPYDGSSEANFLFVLTPPYSGSTALAQVLNTADGTAFLHKKAEGQWLIPGLCAEDRWLPEKAVDWESVRSVWMNRVEMIRALVGKVDLIIEKSPPHMVRLEPLLRTFPNHFVLAMNRNPFAKISSALYRTTDVGSLASEERGQTLERLAGRWLEQSRWIRSAIDSRGIPAVSYESFCAGPRDLVGLLAERFPLLRSVDASKEILVKDYRPGMLENHNRRQLERLSPADVASISTVLKRARDLVDFFGYDASGAEEMEIVTSRHQSGQS